MQVKIFESPDMATGLKMVRAELGPDALILSTRTVRNGKLGILGKPYLEITAAIDNRDQLSLRATTIPARRKNSFRPTQNAPGAHQNPYRKLASVAPADETNGHDPSVSLKPADRETNRNNSLVCDTDNQSSSMAQELSDLKSMVAMLSKEVGRLSTAPAPPATLERTTVATDHDRNRTTIREHTSRDPVIDYLCDFGISAHHAATISSYARESLSFADLARPEIFSSFLRQTIAGLLNVSAPDFSESGQQQRIALIGPTGVGKTTTLAKIAAQYIGSHSSSVALITIDTFRIAAIEQLKVYGEIMRLPVEVVLSPSQFLEALTKHQDKELILIDTAGRSPKDHVSIDELASFLSPDHGIENHLVLSATTRESELLDTIEQFKKTGIDRTIFTKLDECGSLGVLLNVQISNPAPLSYLTNGQRVPEDLLQADRDLLARLILPTGEGTEL